MQKNSKALATVPSEGAIADLRSNFPQEQGFIRKLPPRLGMTSQDVTEGKGKNMKVVTEAGIFYTEKETDEIGENGKKIWKKEEIGNEVQATIFFQRKQLRFYDGEKYTSSPIYDNNDEVIPLFKDKAEVCRGLPAELKARPEFQGTNAKGKPTSKLEENKILYVLLNGEVFQLNLRGTSMYAYQKYARTCLPPAVLTRFNSEAKENGATAWNQMTFTTERNLSADEVNLVQEKIAEVKEGIAAEKEYFASLNN